MLAKGGSGDIDAVRGRWIQASCFVEERGRYLSGHDLDYGARHLTV
jgi:hypothetical protein